MSTEEQSQPDTWWKSATNDFETFSPTQPAFGDATSISVSEDSAGNKTTTRDIDGEFGDHVVLDTSGIAHTLGSDELNDIKWFVSARNLIIAQRMAYMLVLVEMWTVL